MAEFDGMSVNERLLSAGLLDAYNAASATGDLDEINSVLRKVDLRQDENGMNWSLDA